MSSSSVKSVWEMGSKTGLSTDGIPSLGGPPESSSLARYAREMFRFVTNFCKVESSLKKHSRIADARCFFAVDTLKSCDGARVGAWFVPKCTSGCSVVYGGA